MNLKQKISAPIKSEKGAALVEYVTLLALISVVSIGAVTKLGGGVSITFSETTTALIDNGTSTGGGSSSGGGSSGGGSSGGFGAPGSPGYCPPGLTPNGSGGFTVNGRVVSDNSNDGNFAWGMRGGGLSETQRTIFTGSTREQEWYGDHVVFRGRYHWYRPTYIFPPYWDPAPGSC